MKKILVVTLSLVLVAVMSFSFAGCDLTAQYDKYIAQEMRGCFDYFWNETQTSESYVSAYGLVKDRSTENSVSSIAAIGFGLAAYMIGAEEGYVTKAEAEERTLGTLKTVRALQQRANVSQEGFLSHFLDMKTAGRAAGSEISSIDTAILLCGALTAGEYFGGEIKQLANEIYANVNWTAMRMTQYGKHYIAMELLSNGTPKQPWDYYAEQLMIYVLGAGSPTAEYRLDDTEYYDFTRAQGTYAGHTFYYSWFGSIFTYQFSHAFIDFRNKVDKNGTDWWANSVEASLAAYLYCRDNAGSSKSFKEGGWGLTACDRRGSYGGTLGFPPRGWNSNEDPDYSSYEGTIAPYGAISSVVFTPKQSLKALKYYQTSDSLKRIRGDYGLLDSYNLDQMWFATDYVGIDKGITLMMLYNYTCGGIWEQFMANQYVQNGMQVLGFTETAAQ